METVTKSLSSFTLGDVVAFQGLAMVPLFGESADPDYLLLEEALRSGCAHVDEVSESGNVNQLLFVNHCERPVLLLDGEEIRGAKQNRVMNLTILVAAKSELRIPVSCVEAGRWRHDGMEFAPSKQMHYAQGRSARMSQVSDNIRISQSRQADQGEVWNNISQKMERMELHSPSAAMADAYDQSEDRLETYVQALRFVENQVGAIFGIHGQAMGLEYFDSTTTYSRMHEKIVRSFALDAMERKGQEEVFTGEQATAFLNRVIASSMESFDALGLGLDVRIMASSVRGGALVENGRVVHLCAFHVSEGAQTKNSSSRLARSSRRGQRY
ncbi:ARPP-1 family domain-containing protein [Desulfonatronum thioautotrophicum]|uniref:ARPP-1 family domain-containing protein n=1 Tax=Desulfonatronum thioautotrophicum TaxID=617001 RepID=UPI0005EB5E62|nr:DUF6569 family protein [Desulfonatronum thioautotrophicum]